MVEPCLLAGFWRSSAPHPRDASHATFCQWLRFDGFGRQSANLILDRFICAVDGRCVERLLSVEHLLAGFESLDEGRRHGA
jgi:hypothetical protein